MRDGTHWLWRLGFVVAYRALRVYWRVFRPREFSVQAAIWCDAQILLIRHSYRPHWALPGGRTKRREAFKEAAAREVLEEVGIAIAPQDLEFAGVIVSHDEYKENHSHVFRVELLEEPRITVDQREVIAAEFRPLALALDSPLTDSARQFLTQQARDQ